MRKHFFIALFALCTVKLANAQGYCRTSYRVANCSFCTKTVGDHIYADCNKINDESEAADCVCIRPNFAVNDNECKQAIQLIGNEYLIPVGVITGSLGLYNIFYAGYIVKLKAKKSCTKLNFTWVAAIFLALRGIFHMLTFIDPFASFDIMPYWVWTTLIRATYYCHVIIFTMTLLAWVRMVQGAGVQKVDEKTKNRQQFMVRCLLSSMGVILIFVLCVDFSLMALAEFGHEITVSTTITFCLNIVTLSGFLGLAISVIVYGCKVKRRLSILLTGMGNQSHTAQFESVRQLDRVLCIYFFPSIGSGLFLIFFYVVYNLCLGNISPHSWIACWTFIYALENVVSLLLLMTLEGKVFPTFPKCCFTKARVKSPKKKISGQQYMKSPISSDADDESNKTPLN